MKRFNVRRQGFTIVELLIVIIVIGILAALVLVAYGNVTDQAKVSAAKNDLEQIAKQLNTYKEQSGGGTTYPADTSSLTYSNGTTLQYSVNNNASPATYCVTATNGSKSFFVSNTSQAPTAGGCPGHGQNGVAAITNLVRNPTGTGTSGNYYNSGWFYPLGTNVDTPNVSFNGRSDWHRIAGGGSNNTSRARINLSDLTNGQTYTFSILVANPGASSATIEYDFCDQGNLNTAIPAGATQRLYVTGTRSSYDATYSFVDIDVGANTILINQAMLTSGTTNYNYADGSSTNWVWNGTSNASTSTGPAL